MKKILCLIDGLGFGGAQRQLIGLASLLQQKGYIVDLAAYHQKDFYQQLISDCHLNYILLECKRNKWAKYKAVAGLIKRNKYDVVISYINGPNVIACVAKFFNRHFRLIVSERVRSERVTITARMRFFTYKTADYIVSNSYAQQNFIKEKFSKVYPKTKVITNFTDTNFFVPHTNVKESGGKCLRMLVAGRISRSKNVLRFLDTLRILKLQGIKIKVDWFGNVSFGMNEYQDEVMRRRKELQVEDYITFHPGTKDIRNEYQTHDVFCLPSLREGFPNTLCEAMSCGCPVLCSRVCDNPLIVEEGKNGLMFNPESSIDMANVISHFLQLSCEKRTQMGIRSRELALEKFSEEVFVQKYIKLIE